MLLYCIWCRTYCVLAAIALHAKQRNRVSYKESLEKINATNVRPRSFIIYLLSIKFHFWETNVRFFFTPSSILSILTLSMLYEHERSFYDVYESWEKFTLYRPQVLIDSHWPNKCFCLCRHLFLVGYLLQLACKVEKEHQKEHRFSPMQYAYTYNICVRTGCKYCKYICHCEMLMAH